MFTMSRVHGHTFAHYIFPHSLLPRLVLPFIQYIYTTHSPSSYSARIPLLLPLISSLFQKNKLFNKLFSSVVFLLNIPSFLSFYYDSFPFILPLTDFFIYSFFSLFPLFLLHLSACAPDLLCGNLSSTTKRQEVLGFCIK